jgi:hypothetical protein
MAVGGCNVAATGRLGGGVEFIGGGGREEEGRIGCDFRWTRFL